MKRRSVLTGGAALAADMLAPPARARSGRPPNFILFICDDLGAGDISSNLIHTPNIAKMMRDGTRLTDFYAPANLCTPSRVGFMTGRYPVRAGLSVGNINPDQHRKGLSLSEMTIARALKPEYATAAVGKWHLGHGPPLWPPLVHGFDMFYGIPYSHDMSPLAIYDAVANTPTAVKPAREDVDLSQLQQRFAARAAHFIRDCGDKPFFLWYALSAPHLPSSPAPAFKGQSAAGPYGDVVMEIDDILGRLIAQLHAQGIAEDTFLVFTSDNGPWYFGSSGSLRGRKNESAYEAGYRVPCITWQPGTVPAGRESNAITGGIDMLPTFLAMAGKAPPRGVELDGCDLSKVILEGASSPHEALLLFSGSDVVALRTQQWKYVDESYLGQALEQKLKNEGFPQLVDVTVDGAESYNTAELHPEVTAKLRASFQTARAKFSPRRAIF